MAKPTISQLKQKVEELLTIQAVAERYKELEKQVKDDMVALKWTEVDIAGKGRVFISASDQVTISPDLALSELGEIMASKVIVTKKSVSNDVLSAFVKAGEISQADYEKLLGKADHKPKINLYVRPLK